MSHNKFKRMFTLATAMAEPYPYQVRLGTDGSTLPALLSVPTGLGKTAAAILAWVWRRRYADESIRNQTPRRLVYCLPMRVLVEQTFGEAVRWLDRLGLLAGAPIWENTDGDRLPLPSARLKKYEPNPADQRPVGWSCEPVDQRTNRIAVHLLMGGEERTDWALWSERDAVLIGTQDMLLSRALNRGYGARRARWPMEFGLLTNDCLWVLDEIQLMGSGLATSSQLDCFMSKLWNPMTRNCFLWMSATTTTDGLQTQDRDDLGCRLGQAHSLTQNDLQFPHVQTRLRAEKTVVVVQKVPKATQRDGCGILDRHETGRLTLVVLNTVRSATEVFSQLQTAAAKAVKRRGGPPKPEICLLHSRFRPGDRQIRMDRLLDFTRDQDADTRAAENHAGLVLVATQIVEAGLDISASRLWSEIGPWASSIQRLGRLNRAGDQPNAEAFFWKPRAETKGENAKGAPNASRIGPYEKTDIDAAQSLLGQLAVLQEQGELYRDALDKVSASKEAQAALAGEPNAVIRPDDMFELFSTEPDLAGGFTDISHFVRDQDRNVDVQVFWREFDPNQGPSPDEAAPSRNELCPVPFYDFRRFLGNKRVAWEWDFEVGQWVRRRSWDVFPGMTLMLARKQGGYSEELGWTGDAQDNQVAVMKSSEPGKRKPDALEYDPTSFADSWLPLPDHLGDVQAATKQLVTALGLTDSPVGNALSTAARWHDWGKALPRYQEAVAGYGQRVIERCDTILNGSQFADLHSVVSSLRQVFELSGNRDCSWAKWPNIGDAAAEPSLCDNDSPEVTKLLRTSFRPGLRHEAASAIAAWQAWCSGDDGMTALAVYLIASHHGKVRMALRRIYKNDEVFGLREADVLPVVKGYFPNPVALAFDAKHLGARGEWVGDDEFSLSGPSWNTMVAALLGPVLPEDPCPCDAIADSEPRRLGPFKLAYLEALLRVADGRASQQPGKRGQQ